MKNIPEVKLGLVAVSRDCFPLRLSESRRAATVKACADRGIPVKEIMTTVENENDVLAALEEIKAAGVNALVIYLGNFGPEGPETMLAQKFAGPCMFAAAAEESGSSLVEGRGDAYCGLLSASYNLALRKLNPHIPEYPVGTPPEVAEMIADFMAVARIVLGIKKLKIFGFGPRPQDFFACNAPIGPLFDLGVEIMENSELDLYASYKQHKNDARVPQIVREMEAELGDENTHPGILPELARFELTLLDWMEDNLGASAHAAFANKCWPAFQTQFGFVPCYVNSRLAARGIPVACETDIYGALSEYIVTCATGLPATLLDINNTVPEDMYAEHGEKAAGYKRHDLFMGFHCGNTPSCFLKKPVMKHQLIMHRLLEPDREPEITRGTLEGAIRPGECTLFRLQSSADCRLRSYIAQGEVLDIDPGSFGGIGVFAVREMARFYRHVLIAKHYPHHTAVGFKHAGKALFAAMNMLGIPEIDFNRPPSLPYPGENPF